MVDNYANNTGTATFLHREIFHLTPRKVDAFQARLLREYSQRRTQDGSNDGGASHDNGGRDEGARRFIETIRHMNGCYSFDIYCRAESPLQDDEWPYIVDHQDDKVAAFSALEEKEQDQHNEAAVSEPTGHGTDGASPNETEHPEESDETLIDKEPKSGKATKDKKTEFQLPHQFMVMGRWRNPRAHEMFYINKRVQKFFCPLISRRVIQSLPILTMWSRENGVHTHMHENNANDKQTFDGHFVMTRKRILKGGSSNLEEALSIAKELACFALKEEGCSSYEVCTTGSPDFNCNELLEIGVWNNPSHFRHFTRQVFWHDCNLSLYNLFDTNSDETTFWERPRNPTISV